MIAKESFSWKVGEFPILTAVFLALLFAVLFQVFGIVKLLVLATALTIFFLIFKSPFYGLCLLLFSIPFAGLLQVSRGTVFFDTANKMLAYVVAASFFFNLIKNNDTKGISFPKSLQWFFLFMLWSVITMLWTVDQSDSISATIGRLNLLGLAFLVAMIPEGFKQFKTLCIWTTAGAGFLGIYVVFFQMDNLAGDYGSRLAVGTNENVLAHILAIALLLSVIGFRNSKKFTKFFILFLDLFIIYAIALTGSRGTWVALIFSGIVAPLFFPGIGLRRKVAFSTITAVICGIFYFGITQNLFGEHSKIVERIYMISPESAGGRISTIWPYYWQIFSENPIFGAGLGFRNLGFSPHNDVLAVLAELGLIGFIFFAIMQVMFFAASFSIKDPWIRLVALALPLFLLVSGITHTTFGLKSYALAVGFFSYLGKNSNKT